MGLSNCIQSTFCIDVDEFCLTNLKKYLKFLNLKKKKFYHEHMIVVLMTSEQKYGKGRLDRSFSQLTLILEKFIELEDNFYLKQRNT